jgi:hypothetical protein
MSLPANFTGGPQETLNHHCRNVGLEFKKTIKSSKDASELKMELERYINVINNLDWHEKNSNVYRKKESEKAINKINKEFERYIKDLESDQQKANPQNLLDAIAEMEQLTQSL